MKKQKTISVPVFKKGDYVAHKNGQVGIVMTQQGLFTRIKLINNLRINAVCIDFKLITKAEYTSLLPKKLKVSTLNRELVITNGRLTVGCQTISKADAKKIADFITKNI